MDLEQELSKALADPEFMNKVSGVLSSLGKDESKEEKQHGEEKDFLSIKNIMGALSSAPSDDRIRLLMAIKPFLSEKRAPYMDSAVTILKLAGIGKLGKDLKLF